MPYCRKSHITREFFILLKLIEVIIHACVQAEYFFSEEDDPEEPDLINYPQCLPEPDSAADAANHALLLNNIHKVEGTFYSQYARERAHQLWI